MLIVSLKGRGVKSCYLTADCGDEGGGEGVAVNIDLFGEGNAR